VRLIEKVLLLRSGANKEPQLPNWITNRLVAKGNPQRIRNLLHLTKSERQSLDFRRIIPSPEIIRRARKVFSPIGELRLFHGWTSIAPQFPVKIPVT
jgi:hypothetical protein